MNKLETAFFIFAACFLGLAMWLLLQPAPEPQTETAQILFQGVEYFDGEKWQPQNSRVSAISVLENGLPAHLERLPHREIAGMRVWFSSPIDRDGIERYIFWLVTVPIE